MLVVWVGYLGGVSGLVRVSVQLESMEALVVEFNAVRVQHDHYRLKVEDLAVKVISLNKRNTLIINRPLPFSVVYSI